MSDRDEPLARNALIVSLVLCGGVGLLALRPAMVDEPIETVAQAASAAPAASPRPEPELPRRDMPQPPRRAPLELTEQQRKAGFNECSVPDPGPGYFGPPRNLWKGMLYPPAGGALTDDGGFDAIMHFHGGPSARKALVNSARGLVLAGYDMGNGSGAYSQPFGSSMLFDELRASLEKQMRAHTNRPDAHLRKLALSGWSAGYGAVNAILRHGGPAVADAVILLDGFHTSILGDGRLDLANVEPLFAFARLAVEGQRFFFLTHSQIATEDYASTTELSEQLLASLKLRRLAGRPDGDPLGLLSYVERRGFYLRGYGGGDERAHCDHLRHLGDAARMLEERWKTPPAKVD